MSGRVIRPSPRRRACPGPSSPSSTSGNARRIGRGRSRKETRGTGFRFTFPPGGGPSNPGKRPRSNALNNCAPYAGRNRDWTIGPLLTKLEEYNGLGYAARGVPSPYVWSGTDQYRSGKYVRDGIYDPNAVDSQPG